MSWQDFVDQQLVVDNQCYEACILSKLNGVPWANSPGFIPRCYEAQVTQDDGSEATVTINEAANFAAWVETGQAPSQGLRINEVKFMMVKASTDGEFVVYGRKGSIGLAIAASGSALVIGSYDTSSGQDAASCYGAVEKLAEYLRSEGK